MTEENADWDYKPDGQTKKEPPSLSNRGNRPMTKKANVPDTLEWQGHEYIEHQRGASWYLGLLALAALLAVGLYIFMKDYIASGIVVVTAAVVLIFSRQKPRQVTYGLSADGLRINDKLYLYSHFKSFSVVNDGGANSINLMAIKRFLPPISLYFDPSQEVQIVQFLGQYLPYENRPPDKFDRLSRRLKI
jgi:hypothetical protein